MQARSPVSMHRVQLYDEMFDPARATVLEMDYTFGSDSLDTSEELTVVGTINTATENIFCFRRIGS